jgi:hypothetical protein
MRAALRGVIEQPGNFVDNKHVVDWVHWVFTQKPGDEASGVSKLHSIVNPQPELPAPAALINLPDIPPMTNAGYIWFACAFAVCAVFMGWIVWHVI